MLQQNRAVWKKLSFLLALNRADDLDTSQLHLRPHDWSRSRREQPTNCAKATSQNNAGTVDEVGGSYEKEVERNCNVQKQLISASFYMQHHVVAIPSNPEQWFEDVF